MDRNTEQLAADRERLVVSLRKRIHAFLQAGNFPLNDPAFTSQLAEMWAIERLNQLEEEQRREAEAKQRAFVQGQFCAYLAEGHSRAAAARLAGTTPETVILWCRRDDDFASAVRAVTAGQRGALRNIRRGRPTKLTESTQAAIIRLLQIGATRSQAAAGAGISRQTLYSWLRGAPDFRAAVAAAEKGATGPRLTEG